MSGLTLSVYYSCEDWPDSQVKDEDDYISQTAGVSVTYAKTSGLGVREVRLQFKTESSLARAQSDLRDMGFRFVP